MSKRIKIVLIIACLLINVTSVNTDYIVSAASGQWIQDAATGRWWYRYSNGSYPYNQWEKIDGYHYHFDSDGWMQTGWLKVGSYWYYLDTRGMDRPEGARIASDWLFLGSESYHFDSSGRMQTGWHYLYYEEYEDENREMLWHFFDSSGAWQTDSDLPGSSQGHNTIGNNLFRGAGNVKYYVESSDPNATKVIAGFNGWLNKSPYVSISRVFTLSQANVKVSTNQASNDTYIALTEFYQDEFFGYDFNPEYGDWFSATIRINPSVILDPYIMPHEIGHALGLSHQFTHSDSIMNQLNPNVNRTSPTSKDLSNITYMYH